MWGTLLADIVIQMLGTDYARIVKAIYAFAQVRFILSHYLVSVAALVHMSHSLQIRLTRSCYMESREECQENIIGQT
jgi:hypothetical protein